MEHVRWLAEPRLDRPTVIAAFTGWNDAGDAASNAVRHLIEAWGAQPVAEIDPEEFTDFATVRPHVRLTDGVTRSIVWPTVGIWSASTPGGDVILILGPEPALRWRLFSEQVAAVVQRCNATLMLTLGALLADVAHSRPVQLIGTATDHDLIDRFDLQHSRYEGPTGILTVIHEACQSHGLPCASLWAAVPAYASQVPSPKASLALATRACGIVGSPTPLGQLGRDVYEYESRVTAIVNDDDDLLGYVTRLEAVGDDDLHLGSGGDDDDDDDDDDDALDEGAAPIDATRLNSDELMAEVEQFLREQPDS